MEPSNQLAKTTLLLNNESLVREAAMKMKNPIYPFGRCSRVVPVQGVQVNNIYIYPEVNRTLEVYFRDPVNTADYFPMPIDMTGDPIKIMDQHFVKYRTEVSKAVYDQDLGYHQYDQDSNYNTCVHKEVNKKFMSTLGCIPPLLAQNGEICNISFNFSREESIEVKKLFFEVYSHDYHPEACKTPATRTKYETKMTFYMQESYAFVRIKFGKTVKVI